MTEPAVTAVCSALEDLVLLQKLASLLCEDDHVLHDVDRSGVDDPDNTVSGAKFQKQTAFQVELFSIGLIFSNSTCIGPRWTGCLTLCFSL